MFHDQTGYLPSKNHSRRATVVWVDVLEDHSYYKYSPSCRFCQFPCKRFAIKYSENSGLFVNFYCRKNQSGLEWSEFKKYPNFMLKINKLADYGLVVMGCLAQHQQALNAREVATLTRIAVPTVSKVLKALTKAGLLISSRGMQGGYSLARPAENISLTQMLEVLDGDLALTDCAKVLGTCAVERGCGIRHNWQAINNVFLRTLTRITLADMLKPAEKLKEKLEAY